jgi:hypothetical protein
VAKVIILILAAVIAVVIATVPSARPSPTRIPTSDLNDYGDYDGQLHCDDAAGCPPR